jgi:hypothetical protein
MQPKQDPDFGLVGLGVVRRNFVRNMASPGCSGASYQDGLAVSSPDVCPMKNDETLFMRANPIEAAWRLMPALKGWTQSKPRDFPNYVAGSWHPKEAQTPLAQGPHWLLPPELANRAKSKPNLESAPTCENRLPFIRRTRLNSEKAAFRH